MSNGLISAGTGVASCAATVAFTLMSCSLLAVPITGLAVGAIGLAIRHQCLEKDESLTNKDFFVIGGAAAVGAMAGGATVVTVVLLVQGVVAGAMAGSLMGSMLGGMLLPFRPIFIPHPIYRY